MARDMVDLSVVKGGAESAKSGASSTLLGATSGVDPIAYSVDTLLRPSENASTARNASADTPQKADTSQRDISSIFATSATNGSLSGDDRTRVAHIVAARDNLQEADAENRVDGVFAQVKSAADKVRNANDAARKAGIALALKLAPNAPNAPGADRTPRAQQSHDG